MRDNNETSAEQPLATKHWPQKRRWRAAFLLLAAALVGLGYVWLSREQIADNLIAEQIEKYGLEASYDIESIGPQRQIVNNVVIGDPDRPDLTIEEVVVTLGYRFGIPAIASVDLTNPRIYGSYRDGKFSMGALDQILFADSDDSTSLPEFKLRLRDGRGRIDTDYGPVGIKIEGAGPLNDGFDGIYAIVAPNLQSGDCRSGQVSMFGSISTAGGTPAFEGPARLRDLRCPQLNLSLAQADAQIRVVLDDDFEGVESNVALASRRFLADFAEAEEIDADMQVQWRDDELNGRYDVSASGIASPQIAMSSFAAEGSLRGRDGFDRLELQADVSGSNLTLGGQLDATLAGHETSSANTLFGPLIAKLRAGLKSQQAGSSLSGQFTARKTGDVISGVIPIATVTGKNGDQLLSLSRAQFSTAGSGGPRFTGNFMTGGAGLPQIRGRMEQSNSGNLALRMAMAEYRSGDSALAVPQMAISQARSGAIGFAGELRASGPIAGAAITGLRLPVTGNWTQRGGLAVWQECTEVRFDQLILANVSLDQDSLTLCPKPNGAIVEMAEGSIRIAAGTPGAALSGRLGDTPIAVNTGAVGLAYPGAMVANNIEVVLGPIDTASRFTISELQANFGDTIGGSFADADVLLEQVPLDIVDASGGWAFADGALTLQDSEFRLLDRVQPDRFEPLVARDAALTLVDNRISAQAALRNPESGRIITTVDISHNLDDASGRADLSVDNLRFDEQLQPDQLTVLTKGVIALAEGSINGSGQINWSEDAITSGGVFSSDGIDFAAAFGPVKGASGTVEFTDLLSLTTAPGQKITLASINPGIEVLDGEVAFELTDAEFLKVKGGAWPFMGGQLIMRPVDMRIGAEEERRYIFEMVGLDAAVFVSEFELGNLSATGLFDGAIPIIFDSQGNGRITDGLLVSRAPGGNVSYVGELTYEDLSAMANFAFESLRSLNYSQMSVAMDGSLTGEIVTKVRFDGVQQGEGASSNFITRRIAKLPLRFNVNIRSQFYQLITQMKSLYDPAFIRDPREVGLVNETGVRIEQPRLPENPVTKPEDINLDEPTIQTQESESMP